MTRDEAANRPVGECVWVSGGPEDCLNGFVGHAIEDANGDRWTLTGWTADGRDFTPTWTKDATLRKPAQNLTEAIAQLDAGDGIERELILCPNNPTTPKPAMNSNPSPATGPSNTTQS